VDGDTFGEVALFPDLSGLFDMLQLLGPQKALSSRVPFCIRVIVLNNFELWEHTAKLYIALLKIRRS
jgi:hypothetical protein